MIIISHYHVIWWKILSHKTVALVYLMNDLVNKNTIQHNKMKSSVSSEFYSFLFCINPWNSFMRNSKWIWQHVVISHTMGCICINLSRDLFFYHDHQVYSIEWCVTLMFVACSQVYSKLNFPLRPLTINTRTSPQRWSLIPTSSHL